MAAGRGSRNSSGTGGFPLEWIAGSRAGWAPGTGGEEAWPSARDELSDVTPYVPRLVVEWLQDHDAETHRCLSGTLAFVDISGFTALTERLARQGNVGAEEMSDTLNATFGHLLDVADGRGADLVKWGGDAMLLLFDGPGARRTRLPRGDRMRARLREVGRLDTAAGRIDLRMSVGIHSGDFHFFLVGDPACTASCWSRGRLPATTARWRASRTPARSWSAPRRPPCCDQRCSVRGRPRAAAARRPDVADGRT